MTTATIDTETTGSGAANGPRRSPMLPPVHRAAWYGPLGEAVRRIAPTTEADPIAVLVQALALFGAMAGPDLHVRIGGVAHPARIWPLVIGKTSAGRKGTSMAEARRLARGWGEYARRYLAARELSGLASGEGLLHALGASKGDEDQAQAQAPDGRLFVLETEFARTLAAARRDGSTLGPILRQMWDDGSAQIMTKASPLRVDGAHLGMAAHITPRELRLRLNEADLVGGTLNRFLLVASERPHLLPHEPDHPDLTDLGDDLGRALEHARLTLGRRLHRDREAEALWPEVYAALNADDPDGQLGAVLARGPAYTMRLALAFSLTTGSTTITKGHLIAGLAVWHYSVLSARLLFSDARSQAPEQRLLQFIAAADAAGRTKAEIYRFFGGHRRADQLLTLIEQLERARLIVGEREETRVGRPAFRYRATAAGRDPIARILDSHG